MPGGAPASGPGPVRLGRYGDAVWPSPGPDGPTSELQEALDAARGTGRRDDGDPIVLISPDQGRWQELAARVWPTSRRALRWAWGLATAAAAVVIGSLVYAWLAGH